MADGTNGSDEQRRSTRAAVIREVGGPFSVEQIELRAPGPGEVLVRIASASLWAAVPHYISVSPNPKAALALLSRLALLLETSFDTTKLSQDAVQFEREVSHAVSADEKISRYVRELESRSDERAEDDADEESPPLLASGDDIAAQIERYLAEREESNEDS